MADLYLPPPWGKTELDVWTFFQDAKLRQYISSFAQSQFQSENTAFLEAMRIGKASNEALYKTFIRYAPDDPKSRQINISHAVRTKMDALAEANDFTSGSWANHLASARKEIVHMCNQNFDTTFQKSKHFMVLVLNGGSKTVDDAVAELKRAKYLKFASPNGKKVVAKVLVEWAKGDKKAAIKAMTDEKKMLGLLDGDPDAVLKILQDKKVIAKRA